MYLHIHDFPEILMNLHDMLYISYPCFTCSAVFVITYISGALEEGVSLYSPDEYAGFLRADAGTEEEQAKNF
nr:hypothetical protein [Tanacetum cinerariifolium]